MGKLAVVTLILMSSGCAVAIRYPWDKQQEQTTPKQEPKPVATPILSSTSTLMVPGFGYFQNCHGDPVHNTLLVCDPLSSTTPEVKK